MAWNDERVKEHFSFICPKQWHDMEPTTDERVRFCQSCEKNVIDVRSQEEFDAILIEGGCASVLMANGESVVSAPSNAEENDNSPSSHPPVEQSRTSGTIPDENAIRPPPPPDLEMGMRTSGTIPEHAIKEMEAQRERELQDIPAHGLRTSGTIPEGYIKDKRRRARNRRIKALLLIAVPLIGIAALCYWLVF